MPTTLVAQYRRWFDYEKDVHRQVIDSLETVPADNRGSEAYLKALTLLGHLIAARRIWLYRLGKLDTPPSTIFPTDVTLDDLKTVQTETNQSWDAYLAAMEESDLDRVLDYKTLTGDPLRRRVEDILAQLYGHSWYHRGQIATLVKALGGTPAITDFIYWCRETPPTTA